MVYLPDNLNMLKVRLIQTRESFDKAKKRFDHFISVQKSELYDKFVAEPIDDAKSNEKECQRLLLEKEAQLKELEIEASNKKQNLELEAQIKESKKQVIYYEDQLTKAKQRLEEVKRTGPVKYNIQFEKDRLKKAKQLKLRDLSKEIKDIKQKMQEIDPNSLEELESKKTVVPNAQSRFELNF
jgi:hypothetical protein